MTDTDMTDEELAALLYEVNKYLDRVRACYDDSVESEIAMAHMCLKQAMEIYFKNGIANDEIYETLIEAYAAFSEGTIDIKSSRILH